MDRTVYVVPHCHWDREWYQPHELFRWRLVQMIDELLDHMERRPEYTCFNLDGQTIVIEDYLELRPENEGRLRALIESGRIVIGPWLVQPDEFLPSGESHIRSFQRGLRFAERLGGSLKVGHCADQFGHIAQMPQIMAQLGLTSACLWRGVPDGIPGWSFWWRAPDGTRLPVLYLRNSYSSGWRLPADPDELVERTRRQERDRREDEPALLMNGTDHSRMEKHVPAALAAAAGRGYDYRLATLAEYERAQFAAGIDEVVWEGELRSPDRSNVLVGVLSARMNIKQRDFAVGSFLERVAEPLELLAHLHHGPDAAPALKHAWRLMLENSPHDSICGCSVDQTHREMLPRYDRAEQLARQVARESMAHVVTQLESPAGGAVAVFRPVPGAQAVVECDVPADWDCSALRLPDGRTIPAALGKVAPAQVLQRETVTPQGARRHLDFLREGRHDVHAIEDLRWSLDAAGHLSVETLVGDDLNVVDDDLVRGEVREVVTHDAATTAEVTVTRSGRRRLSAVLPASDTIGLELLVPVDAPPGKAGIRAGGDWIANDYFRVRFARGRLAIRDLRTGLELKNAATLVDETDRGDEYNADILPDGRTAPRKGATLAGLGLDAVSGSLTVEYRDCGLRGSLNRKRTRRRGEGGVDARLTVTLYTGLPRVDLRVEVENEAKDHRLRLLFPLPFAVDHAITENQFHVAERDLTPAPWNGASAEQPPTTFPQKTFAAFEADGRGFAVFHRGLQEGEVVRDRKGRQAYALTLLRCVGWLSRNDLVSRRAGAGPMIETPDAQMSGSHTFNVALTTYSGTWREAGVQPMAHAFAIPPLAYATNAHEGAIAGGEAPLARFETPGVTPTLLGRSEADGMPLMRVYNANENVVTTSIGVSAGSAEAELTDLVEQPRLPLAAQDGRWRFALRPWEIATVRFGRA